MRIIDVHNHYYPPAYIDALAQSVNAGQTYYSENGGLPTLRGIRLETRSEAEEEDPVAALTTVRSTLEELWSVGTPVGPGQFLDLAIRGQGQLCVEGNRRPVGPRGVRDKLERGHLARSVGDDGARPDRADDVHITRASF